MRSVIIFIPTLITGGAEKLVVDLAVNIDKEIFDVSVAVVSGTIPEGFVPNKFLSILEKNNIKIFNLKGKNKFETAKNIRKLFRKKRPDIIHTNLNTVLYVMLFAAIYDTKIRIFTFHNVANLSGYGLKKQLYKLAFKILNFTPVAICDLVKSTISKDFNIPFEKIPCIYNGVDTKAFYPKIRSFEKRTVQLISTGILYHIKNHKLLIDAFAKVELRHTDIHLNILGDGELREELERQITEYGLEDKINILGITDDVAYYLNLADIYVMSSNSEGLPLSVLEAMACGLPIITTEAGGVVDIVKNGENGFITPVGDVESLSRAMIELIENDKLRKAMGTASRKKAIELDILNCVGKYQKLYMNEKLDDLNE
ncbi:MAG: glycosyltransferase [Eubacteriales bacterium]|nr:glycosyltransferase [Eubacteriales bacterium]